MRFGRIMPYALGGLLLVSFAALALWVLPDRQYSLHDRQSVQVVSDFVCELNGERRPVSLPMGLGPLAARTPVTLYADVTIAPNLSLYVKSVYAPLRLYVNDELIYASGQAGDFPALLIDPPTRVSFVNLPADATRVRLRLEFLSPVERSTLALHPLFIGNDNDILRVLLRTHGPSLVFAFILLFIGALLILMSLVHMRGERAITAFLWLGLFALATGTWVLGESNLTVFFIPYPSLLYILSFTGLFTVGIPLMQLGLTMPNLRYKIPLQAMSATLTLCAATALILQGMGIVGLSRSMYFFHILTPLALVVLTLCMVWEGLWHKNLIARRMIAPVLVVAVGALVELLSYRLQLFAFIPFITMPFQTGALLFVLIMSGIGGAFLLDSRRVQAEKQRLESEMGLMERSVRMQKAHYVELNEKIDAAIRYRHDERHHLQSLYNIWESKDYERLGEYLATHLPVPPPLKRIVLCRHLVIDAILRFYSSLCQEAGVDFVCEVDLPPDLPPDLPLSDAELSILWGNLLENAYEAVVKPGTPGPMVRVKASCDEDLMLMRVENTFAIAPKKKKGVLVSQKHSGPGVGTESVKALVASRGGEVIFRVENHSFCVSVLLRRTGAFANAQR